MKKKIFLLGIILGLVLKIGSMPALCAAEFWRNDLRSLFIKNQSYIYTLNIRNFAAVDNNNDDIIEPSEGDIQGTFLNAMQELPKLKKMGINTIYLLPITKTGKLKALGTAGSLYALDSFDGLNPQLDDKNDKRTVEAEAKAFINKAHKMNLRVVVDLPSCGSYDLSLERPDLFIKNKGEAVIPADWTDIRLFKVYNDDKTLNKSLLDEFKKLVKLFQDLGVDGIRADVAAIKPAAFWSELITYAREADPEFLFIAEATTSWENPAKGYSDYATVEELLVAGFDGYYGDWSNFKDITKASDFTKRVQNDVKISEKFNKKKTTMSAFSTHDQQSPIVIGGIPYWEMINWLNVTLPHNPYTLDGFQTGDDYIYAFENKKAKRTFTDDDFYFVHRGKFDIFNFSRKPNGRYNELQDKLVEAMKFRYWLKDILSKGSFTPLNSGDAQVFAFERRLNEDIVVVVGNLNKEDKKEVTVSIKGLKQTNFISPIKADNPPQLRRSKIHANLKPYEIQVYLISNSKD